MNDRTKQLLIRIACLSGAIIFIFFLLYVLSLINLAFTEKEFIRVAENVCEASTAIDSSKLRITGFADDIKRQHGFTATLSATYGEKKALIFLFPITGKYGIYSAVFLYEQSKGCCFCGLAGNGLQHPPQYYGITPIRIAIYTNRIQAIMAKKEVPHEK
ncbi:MAG: hypothetical protein ACTTJ7_03695 [Treponema sp.]